MTSCVASDVVFLLDTLNTDVMSALFTFLTDVIDKFPDVGRQATRVALITFAEQPRVDVYLDDFDSKHLLQVARSICLTLINARD